jgi:hypothetical protein
VFDTKCLIVYEDSDFDDDGNILEERSGETYNCHVCYSDGSYFITGQESLDVIYFCIFGDENDSDI